MSKSFDRFIAPGRERGPISIHDHHNETDTWNGVFAERVRCVPWPEGAPDPNTVPHAGEQVRWSSTGKVYYVVNGIPRGARLEVHSLENGTWRPETKDLTVYVPKVVPERTFTEAEVRAAYEAGVTYTSQDLIDQLKENQS